MPFIVFALLIDPINALNKYIFQIISRDIITMKIHVITVRIKTLKDLRK